MSIFDATQALTAQHQAEQHQAELLAALAGELVNLTSFKNRRDTFASLFKATQALQPAEYQAAPFLALEICRLPEIA